MSYLASQLTRKAPSSYADGVYMMAGSDRPSPRNLSQVVMKGEDGLPSRRNLTALFAFFGKQMISFIHSSLDFSSSSYFPRLHVFPLPVITTWLIDDQNDGS